MRRIILVLVSISFMALSGCGKEEAAPEAAPKAGTPTAGAKAPSAGAKAPAAGAKTPAGGGQATGATGEAMSEAKNIFNMRCAICHGPEGKGDGPGAASLTPKPRDYTDKEWQGSVTDDYLKKVLVEGGTSVGRSAIMPPNPDLAQKPEVLDAMVQIIRGFAK
ncbi:c-type cytochrome [Haliangium sp.]|uniref:c-type cytochrome n=1 Tax=Haliangium sp. TaxID=2663208 RepID=UPI003D0CA61C